MSEAAPFRHLAVIGLGLIGSSIARAARQHWPDLAITGFDNSSGVRERATALKLCDAVNDDYAALAAAELVILCVPVGAMEATLRTIAPHLAADAIVSDVGSSKEGVATAMRGALPGKSCVPAHPVAGTENSGPDAGFASLFRHRWCILTPDPDTDQRAIDRVAAFWRGLGAEIEIMDAAHHDRVLAVTSHLPHLIAYTIVGTASDLEEVTRSEVIKYSAGGFRDFTRIAASDPVMWRDVFLANKEAVLDMLQRFTEDLTSLQRAIRRDEGDTLEALFARTRRIRRNIIEQGQDDATPDFGRRHDAED